MALNPARRLSVRSQSNSRRHVGRPTHGENVPVVFQGPARPPCLRDRSELGFDAELLQDCLNL